MHRVTLQTWIKAEAWEASQGRIRELEAQVGNGSSQKRSPARNPRQVKPKKAGCNKTDCQAQTLQQLEQVDKRADAACLQLSCDDSVQEMPQ